MNETNNAGTVLATVRRCLFASLGCMCLLICPVSAQEIITNYEYSSCTQPCPGVDYWAKTTEPDGSYQISTFYYTGTEYDRKYYNSAAQELKMESYVWMGTSVGTRLAGVNTYAGSLLSSTSYDYDAAGNTTQEIVYYGTAPPASFKGRRVVRTFQSFPNNIWRPEEESVYDLDPSDNTSLVSRTHYYYDQFTLTNRSGMPGHDTANYGTGFTTRANPTTISRWLASESRWIDAAKNYYDILGNVTQTTDARNYSTTISYSSTFHFAYPTQVTNAKNQTMSTNYSFNTGQVASVTNANNKTATTSYDSLNRVSHIDNPDGSYIRATYNLALNNFSTTLYRSVAAGQESSTTTYLDGIGREKLKRASDPAGDTWAETVYAVCDCNGKVAKVSNPFRPPAESAAWTETQYDALGRVSKIIPPDGTPSSNNTAYSYDLATLSTTVTDPAGKVKKYEYDVMGRIWRATEPDSSGQLTQVTTYNYLPTLGQNKLVITQGVQTRTFNYDTLGRLTSEIHPENGTISYSYDDAGNTLSKLDARNWTTNFSYDQINRLTGKTYLGDGGVTPAVTMTYDTAANGVGMLASWTAGSASGSSSYNSMGRPTSENRTIGGLTYTAQWAYSLGGQITTTTFPNGYSFTNGYDTVGNLETVTTNFTGTVVNNVDRNAAGAATLVAYANGVNHTRTYSSTLQLSTLRVTGPGGTYLDYSYNYNAGASNNGRIRGITDNVDSTKSVTYTYDELNRLKTAETSGAYWGLTWTYDRYGNRSNQSLTKGSGPTNSLSVDSNTNRVSGWTYDAAGNVLNDGRNTYSYDAENRVIAVNGGATTYSYDAFGGVSREAFWN